MEHDTKFKVGDVVRVTVSTDEYKIGAVATISSVGSVSIITHQRIYYLDGNAFAWLENSLELVETTIGMVPQDTKDVDKQLRQKRDDVFKYMCR